MIATDPLAAAAPPEPLGVGWERLTVALEGSRLGLARGVAEIRPHLARGDAVALLVAGEVAALGPLTALLEADGTLVLVSRTDGGVSSDDLAPTLGDLVTDGTVSTAVLLARPGCEPLLDHLHELLCAEPSLTTGQALELISRHRGVTVLDDPTLGVGRWRAPKGPIALLDVAGVDPDRPWWLTGAGRRPRVPVSEHPELWAALSDCLDQLTPTHTGFSLPGAVPVDRPMREVVAANLTEHLHRSEPCCPQPFSDTAAFLDWLTSGPPEPGRYWSALWESRTDLQKRFPEVAVGRYARFNRWSAERWTAEGSSFLLRADGTDGYEVADTGRSADGVNVIGYLDRASGLGEVARELADALEVAGLPVARIAIGRTPSPRLGPDEVPALDQDLRFDTSIVVGTAEEVPFLAEQLGPEAFSGRRTIGYWFWELAEASPAAAATAPIIDEVWTATRFVHDAFAGRIPQPVRLAPLPRPTPAPSTRGRVEFGLPADRFVVLCAFSLLSVSERKNPLGAIAAFTAAFEPNEGPLLVVKTMNGEHRYSELEGIRLAAAGRPDILIWDETLSGVDNLALVREADCLLSLHRSEGLGLHLLEAMALGTAVIATGYSGPLDFLDETCAEIVPFRLVGVTSGEGAYPDTQLWADPDIAVAATALRRLATDPGHRAALTRRAQRAIAELPAPIEAGRALRSLMRR